MQFSVINTDYMTSVWFECYEPKMNGYQRLNPAWEIKTRYSPTTDWEKVFSLGDQINNELNMTEKEVLNEVNTFRIKRKAKK